MDSDAKNESILIRLKNILKQNDVKLWLPPYHEDPSNEEKNSAKCFMVRKAVFFNLEPFDFLFSDTVLYTYVLNAAIVSV